MKKARPVIVVLPLIVVVLFILLKNNHSRNKGKELPRQEQTETGPQRTADTPNRFPRRQVTTPPSDGPVRDGGFDRRTSNMIYTKHARCRMACRHIDESEVQEILEKGIVNERKSEPAGRPDPKYALEGRTHDGQQVRIVFAPTSRGMVVITVIDLDTNWSCDCK
ncbi:DUF4258 domain-containing protein [Pseudoflavitalea sp. X16]|uniref:DUF4258 domain-containing protein n=1 Tax=Paraflavitalea devenefica TaxID=2716334 RepID=UPI00142357A9|nr:DUF4258 domain-containing protein [Paraflavitalea devenefica]NII29519.1 DUF4258 domain-containing protein [Paraflavitalea devenefica]